MITAMMMASTMAVMTTMTTMTTVGDNNNAVFVNY